MSRARELEISSVHGRLVKERLVLQIGLRAMIKKNAIERLRVEICIDENPVKIFYPMICNRRTAERRYTYFVLTSSVGLKGINYGRHEAKVTAIGFGSPSGSASIKHFSIDYTPNTQKSRILERSVCKEAIVNKAQTIDIVSEEERKFYDEMRQRMKRESVERRDN